VEHLDLSNWERGFCNDKHLSNCGFHPFPPLDSGNCGCLLFLQQYHCFCHLATLESPASTERNPESELSDRYARCCAVFRPMFYLHNESCTPEMEASNGSYSSLHLELERLTTSGFFYNLSSSEMLGWSARNLDKSAMKLPGLVIDMKVVLGACCGRSLRSMVSNPRKHTWI